MKKVKIFHAHLYGLRSLKYATLNEESVETTKLKEISPKPPYYLFIPRDNEMEEEYEQGWKITEIMSVNNVGIVTARDKFALDFKLKELKERISDFIDENRSDSDVRNKYLSSRDKLNVHDARIAIRNSDRIEANFVECLYRPFDIRFLFYHDAIIERSRKQTMHHMLQGDNFGIVTSRQAQNGFRHVLVTNYIANLNSTGIAGKYGSGYLFPLYLYPEIGESKMELETERKPNLNPEFVKEFLAAIGAKEMVNSQNVGERSKPSDSDCVGATSLIKGGNENTAPGQGVSSPLTREMSEGQRVANWQDNLDLIERAKEHNFSYKGRYLPYDPNLKQYARELRKNMTKAERKLWYDFLKKLPQRFIRQHPIDYYIVDFYCPEAKLVIEIDGDTHFTEEGKQYDEERTHILEQYRLRVIRYKNVDVLGNFDSVCANIEETLRLEQVRATSLIKGGNENTAPGQGVSSPLTREMSEGQRVLSPLTREMSEGQRVIYPEDIFYYIYAVLHSPTYRERYAEFLKIDFPRIPLPKNYENYDKLADFGKELVEYHLMKKKSWGKITQHGEALDTTIGKVKYDENKQEIILDSKRKPEEQVRLGIVPKHIWEFHIGGYQVLHKWLKDRKGREIELGDYVPIINAIIETDRVMKEIDPLFSKVIHVKLGR